MKDPVKKKFAVKNMRALVSSFRPARKRLAVKNQNDSKMRGRDNAPAMKRRAFKTRRALETDSDLQERNLP